MKLQDYREVYYTFSGKASDVARQLSFAGIALIWIFKIDKAGPLAVPEALILPAALFVLALGLDLLQYAFGSLIWGVFSWHHEQNGVKLSAELTAPRFFNWPSLICFWLKLLTVVAAYGLVSNYIRALLCKT